MHSRRLAGMIAIISSILGRARIGRRGSGWRRASGTPFAIQEGYSIDADAFSVHSITGGWRTPNETVGGGFVATEGERTEHSKSEPGTMYLAGYGGSIIFTMQVPRGISRAASIALHRQNPRKTPVFRSQHGKHEFQNLWPLNSRWLWFWKYFAKYRGTGFSPNAPAPAAEKWSGVTGTRMLPVHVAFGYHPHTVRISSVPETSLRSIRI